MLKQYDGRSFAEVLQTEVFANGSNLPDLMAAFGTLGVGTGGFSHLYDAAFLEVLRVLLWDIHGEFMLPEQDTNPQLFGPDEGGAWASPWVWRARHCRMPRTSTRMTFDDMFKVNSPVERIRGDSSPGCGSPPTPAGDGAGGLRHRRDDEPGHAEDAARSPLRGQPVPALSPPPEASVTDFVRPSCQAAIKRLDVVSGYRMNTELDSPRIDDTWPEDSEDNKIMCFVTDKCARLAYVLPEVPPDEGLVRVTVAEAYGSDADKFTALPDSRVRRSGRGLLCLRAASRRRWRRRACRTGGHLLNLADVNDVDWSSNHVSRAPSRSTSQRTTTSAAACSTTTSSPIRRTFAAPTSSCPATAWGIWGAGSRGPRCRRSTRWWVSAVGWSSGIRALCGWKTGSPRCSRATSVSFIAGSSISGRAPRKSGLSSMVRLGNWETTRPCRPGGAIWGRPRVRPSRW